MMLDMMKSLDRSVKDETRISHNDLLALTALAVITLLSALIPYAVCSPTSVGAVPNPPVPTMPVCLLSALAEDLSYYDCSEIASAVRLYGIVFVMLT